LGTKLLFNEAISLVLVEVSSLIKFFAIKHSEWWLRFQSACHTRAIQQTLL